MSNDNEKTDQEREIFRKLDALRAAMVNLSIMIEAAPGIEVNAMQQLRMRRVAIDKAWGEKDEELLLN